MEHLAQLTDGPKIAAALEQLKGQELGKNDVKEILPQIIKWATTVGCEFLTKSAALASITAFSREYPEIFTADQILLIDTQLVSWLMDAGLSQAPNPYSKSIFGKDRPPNVTELDGSPCRDMFTVLNLGQYYTESQLLNIQAFNSLKPWLIMSRLPGQPKDGDALAEKVVDYCFRVLEQYERKPKVSQDVECQRTAVRDTIEILDHLCKNNVSMVPRIFDNVKRLYSKIGQDTGQGHVLIAVMQFFMNHSEAVVYDPQQLYNFYFDKLLASQYMDHTVAYETLQFLKRNLEHICYNTNLLKTYFPNIFKILAWNPRSYVGEFMDILPAILSSSTSIEVFHTLLDLPVVTAAIETKLKSSQSEFTQNAQYISAIESYSNPMYRPLFHFLLRTEGGHGDTIDRLGSVHSMLKEFHQHPRVTVCCQVIPILLRVYFDTVLECGETSLLSELVPVLIERAGLLYGTTLYHQDVRRIFVEGLLNIFKAHPNILIDQQADILEFISTLRNASDKEDFFIHILWVIGEYLSPMYDTRCLPEVISSFYSALECIAYELSSSLPTQYSTMPHSCRLVTVMITAMSKLASRSQDLIPRVLLCLTKLEQQVCLHVPADHAGVLHARTTELVNLLKVPNVASAVLSPDADIDSGKLHKDSMSTPVLLHFIHDVLNSQQL